MARILPVRTVFYRGKDVVKKIASGNPLNAVSNCTRHMRKNTYEATHAEVYSTDNGKLHSVLKRDMRGNLHILYEAPPNRQELEA